MLTLAPMMFVMFAASLSAKPLFGLLLAAFALYGGLALLLEEGRQRSVLPMGRRGLAKTSLDGDLQHQVRTASQEPGV